MVTYREAEPSDVPALVALVGRCDAASPWLDVIPPSDKEQERLLRHVTDPEHWLLLAEDAGVPVGLASLRPGNEPPACHLSDLFVEPELWGRGIGRGLLERAAEELRRRGCGSGTLVTHVGNDPARAVYERLGWRDSGRRHLNDEGEELATYELSL